MSEETVIVAGSVAQKPAHGGHTWVFLQYLLGFKDLGWKVLFLDRLEPDMCVDAQGEQCSPEDSLNFRYLHAVMDRFGLNDAYALLYDKGKRSLGLSRQKVLERVKESAFLLNVNGFLTDEEILDRAPLRVFLDIDPGFWQMWQELGLHDAFHDHDRYVTIGQNIGRPDCTIPTCGVQWITTAQPVVLQCWPAQQRTGDVFTSVGSWRGPFGPVEYRGTTYGLRAHECRKFAELPRVSGQRFEMALDIDATESKDLALLQRNGWSLPDPRVVAGDPFAYREYVQRSKAEFMVAKGMYVHSRSGWFSDRSICYLASGKPVLAQDTDFTRLYPTGAGLLSFTTFDQAVTGVEEISRDYGRHAHAARDLAEQYFDSRKILSRLLAMLNTALTSLGMGL